MSNEDTTEESTNQGGWTWVGSEFQTSQGPFYLPADIRIVKISECQNKEFISRLYYYFKGSDSSDRKYVIVDTRVFLKKIATDMPSIEHRYTMQLQRHADVFMSAFPKIMIVE